MCVSVRQIKVSTSTVPFTNYILTAMGGTKGSGEWNAFVLERYAVVDYVD
jgi:hypothetical protein